MSAQGKNTAGLVPIPTCFNLVAGHSKATEKADISPEEGDFGEPDAEKNSLEGGGRKDVPTCRVSEQEMTLEEVQSLLKQTEGGQKLHKCNSHKKRNEARKLSKAKKGNAMHKSRVGKTAV